MAKILVSGLINTETTVKVKQFPIPYYPIDYPFFGVNTQVAGVAYNVAKALTVLGDEVTICTMTGTDFAADCISEQMRENGLSDQYVKKNLQQTPNTAVLYDEQGKRQIYCDLKDIQETSYGFTADMYAACDLIVACNTNFNRELLAKAKEAGKIIATDVHVLSDIEDDYNADFMRYADILFLSDEHVPTDYKLFLTDIAERYENQIIVLGRGDKGACMYLREGNIFHELTAVSTGAVVNTVGAGDALFSGFVHYYAKGCEPREALLRAEIAASMKIGYDGAAQGFPDEETVEAFYQIYGRESIL